MTNGQLQSSGELPIFYVYCIIFAAGTFGWIYFHHVGASLRWQSVGATLSFIALYRGVFFKWMHADKTFRVTCVLNISTDKDWTCKVMIREKGHSTLYINNKINNHVNWEDLTKFEEAKTYYKLTSKDQIEGVMLDKESFTRRRLRTVSNNGC